MLKLLKLSIVAMALFSIPTIAASNEYLGDRECYACHKDIKKVYLNDMHGKIFTSNPRNSLEKKGCEACHGAGAAHKDAADRADKGEKVSLEVALPLKKGPEFTAENNKLCLSCHEKGTNTHWKGSEHEMADVACVDCHTIHAEEKIDINDSCASCHMQQRAKLQRSSHIPLREGALSCVDCHNPHGGTGPALLKQSSLNDNCYSCHAEKRGPLIWEHAPVRENCGNCHDPHGSNYQGMLKMKNPYLCQSCHFGPYHIGEWFEGAGVTGKDKHIVGKGCLNCHGQIHGSNHPSGTFLQR